MLEVPNQLHRIASKVAEVDCLTTLAQKKQAIKRLEEFGGRLMDPEVRQRAIHVTVVERVRAQNSQPLIRQASKARNDGPSTLRVQT